MSKILSIIIISIIIPFSLLANNEDAFDKGNELYNEANYEQAIQLYDSLLNNNIESAAIYYNIGNAYFKLDNVPKALLYFEKAKKIEPNNADIIYNIELANTRIADKIESVPEFFLRTLYVDIRNSLNEAQWTTVNIGLLLVFLTFVIMFFTMNNKRQLWLSMAVVFLILTFICGLIGYKSYKEKVNHNTAIVFTPTIDIKSAPDTKSSTIFILHQGTKVELLEKSSKWQKIRIASGSEGWLELDNLEKI